MSENHWRPVMQLGNVTEFPRDYERIEIWRDGWAEPQATRWEDINPMMNAIGLMWRPISERHKPEPYQLPLSSARSSSLPLSLGRVFGLE